MYRWISQESRRCEYMDAPSRIVALIYPVRSVWDHLCFTTEHRIHRYNNPAPSRQLMAPSDHYVFDTLAFVIDPAANHSVRIATLAVTGTIGDFVVRSHDAAATNVLNSSPGGELVNTGIESRVLQVEIELSVIALANAISLFLINWLAAVGSIYVTIMVTSGRLERNNVAAAGPFSALVAVPTVRSLYISSPVLTGPVGESSDRTFNHFIQGLTHHSRVGCIFR